MSNHFVMKQNNTIFTLFVTIKIQFLYNQGKEYGNNNKPPLSSLSQHRTLDNKFETSMENDSRSQGKVLNEREVYRNM